MALIEYSPQRINRGNGTKGGSGGIGFIVDGTSLPFFGAGQLRRAVGSFGVVMWADDHRSTETLFAVVDALAAQGGGCGQKVGLNTCRKEIWGCIQMSNIAKLSRFMRKRNR